MPALEIHSNLPFVEVVAAYRNSDLIIPNVLIDTGSASTILSADIVETIGIVPEADDIPLMISGVGGYEVVYKRKIDYLKIGEFCLNDFEIDVGGMDYGFEIYGIIGMDFLRQAGAIIDLNRLIIEFQGG